MTPDAADSTPPGEQSTLKPVPRSEYGSSFGADLQLSRYDIVEEVGRGGMGVVYHARHQALGSSVAIKVCLPGLQPERFLREARLLAKVRSPHIVAVHDFDRLPDGTSVLVMDWVPGADLSHLIAQARAPLSEARVLEWMQQVATGMQAVADEGIVHRDLKPSNILIDESSRARVSDFGLARLTDDRSMTHAGNLLGTPHYMAPEQAEDPRGVDTRADIYSFGATFYHALTGATPFQGETAFSILFKHKTEPLIAPRSINPAISKRVNEVLERCLAKSPRDRYSSFRDLLARLAPSADASDWDADDPDLSPHWERYLQRRDEYLTKADPTDATFDTYYFPNQRRLQIVHGKIAEQTADAIVSMDDYYLSVGTGIAAQIVEAAGPFVYPYMRILVPVRPGRVAVTHAGRLRARLLFHAVTISPQVGESAQSRRGLIAEVLTSCFYQADSHHVASMAMPLLLSTRVDALDPNFQAKRRERLDVMFQQLTRMLLRGVTEVSDVSIVIDNTPLPIDDLGETPPADL